MEDAELAEDGAAIVVDLFAGEAVVGVEGVDAAEREFDAAAGWGQAAPSAEVRAADYDFYQDCVVGHVAALLLAGLAAGALFLQDRQRRYS